MTDTPFETTDIERLALKRAKRKMGWYTHAFVYLAVNLGLLALALLSGHGWITAPALGWGLGLMIHGLVVFAFMPGNGMLERLVQRERAQLVAQRDPW